MREKVVVVLGPTATGKSALGLCLAQRLDTEIISGDSMLVYKGFDIGTAKPSKRELAVVKHHLVDIVSPEESYSAAAFQQQAKALVSDINARGKLPIVVGGTGLYIKALLEGYEFPEIQEQPQVRKELELLAEREGSEHLFAKLKEIAPDSAEGIHPNNKKRLIRALEVALCGGSISREKNDELVYDVFVVGLAMERQQLYEKINQRVEAMFALGLLDEVRNLILSGAAKRSPAMQGIGYKEVVACLDGDISFEECKRLVALHTRNFAKRQLTWYKKMPYVNWYDASLKNLCKKIHSSLVEWRKVE